MWSAGPTSKNQLLVITDQHESEILSSESCFVLSDFWIVAKYNRMTTAGMFVYRCVMFYKIAKKINYCGQRPDSSIFTGLIEKENRVLCLQSCSFKAFRTVVLIFNSKK